MQHQPAEHLVLDRVQRQVQRADDAEVATAAAQPPEQLGVLVRRCAHEPSVGGHELGADEVVAGEAVLALQPARAAAEGEAGDAGGRHAPSGGCQAMRGRRAVELGPGGAAADAGHAALGVDGDVGHVAHVEHEPIVDQRPARDRVPAAAHRDGEALLAGEGQRRDHVVGRRAARDERRPAVDHRVGERAGVDVGGVAGLVQAAAQAEAQLGDGDGSGVRAHGPEATVGRARALRRFGPSGRDGRMRPARPTAGPSAPRSRPPPRARAGTASCARWRRDGGRCAG